MTLGEYYSSKHRGISPEKRLSQIHRDIRKRGYAKKTLKQCKDLQDFLNQAFYPEKYLPKDGKNYTELIARLVSQAYQEKYDIALSNFQMGSSGVTYGDVTVSSLPTLLREKHESFEHSSKIYISTIQSRLDRVKQALAGTDNVNTPDVEAYRKELLSLEQMLNELLSVKGVEQDKSGAYLALKGNEPLLQAVNIMDQKFAAASKVGGIFKPQDYGQVLEWILQAFSNNGNSLAEQAAEHLVDGLVEQMTNTAGSSKTTSKGDFLKVTSKDIKVDGTFVSTGMDDKGQAEYSVSDGVNSFSFSAVQGFNPDSERQGKMDVNFTFNDSAGKSIPFRISAKNWQTLDRDFGETNIAYALLRSAGNESTVEYAFAMQDKYNTNIVNAAHRLAKYSILIDILMGYSQTENYADTIVINVRSEQRVIVGSIVDIIDQINKDLDNLAIAGYEDDTIHANMMIIRGAIDKTTGRSKEYTALSLKYLQATRVRLTYSAIQNAIRTPLSKQI